MHRPQVVGSLVAHQLLGSGSGSSSSSSGSSTGGRSSTPLLHSLLKRPGAVILASTAEAVATFHQDWEVIKAGHYKLPWDMTTPSHQQFNPLHVLSRSATRLVPMSYLLRQAR
jgi:hypothetical protein